MCARITKLVTAGVTVAVLSSCVTASEHRADVSNPTAEKLTVGTVQKEIRVGMSGAEVAQALGSPNVVTTDELRREVWMHDGADAFAVAAARGCVPAA